MEVLTRKDQFRKDLSYLLVEQMGIIPKKEKEVFDNIYLINKINDLLDKYNEGREFQSKEYNKKYCYKIIIKYSEGLLSAPKVYYVISGNMEELCKELEKIKYANYITSIERVCEVSNINNLEG